MDMSYLVDVLSKVGYIAPLIFAIGYVISKLVGEANGGSGNSGNNDISLGTIGKHIGNALIVYVVWVIAFSLIMLIFQKAQGLL